MGQSASTTATIEDNVTSGVSLSPELEAEIVQEFQNQTIQEEWNKFRSGVLIRRKDRLRQLKEQQQQRGAQETKPSPLDHRIDQLLAQFNDESVALQYDANQLAKRYGAQQGIQLLDSQPLPCVGERAHWIDCQKKYAGDARPCHTYVDALERCVTRTVLE